MQRDKFGIFTHIVVHSHCLFVFLSLPLFLCVFVCFQVSASLSLSHCLFASLSMLSSLSLDFSRWVSVPLSCLSVNNPDVFSDLSYGNCAVAVLAICSLGLLLLAGYGAVLLLRRRRARNKRAQPDCTRTLLENQASDAAPHCDV